MTLILGKDKEVTITPWKAKTKKEFIKLFNGEQELKEEDLISVLIMPSIDRKEAFYTTDEIQYILTQLKSLSVGDSVDFSMDCEKCKTNFDIHLSIGDIVNYRPSNYGVSENVIWRDIPTKQIFDDAVKNFPDEAVGEIEMLLHISAYKGVTTTSLEQILEVYNDMTISESQSLIDEYLEVRPLIELSSKLTCTNPDCGQSDDYDFDIIPGFFDELMPT